MLLSVNGELFKYVGPGVYDKRSGEKASLDRYDYKAWDSVDFVYMDLDSVPPTHVVDVLTDNSRRNWFWMGWTIGFLTGVLLAAFVNAN